MGLSISTMQMEEGHQYDLKSKKIMGDFFFKSLDFCFDYIFECFENK